MSRYQFICMERGCGPCEVQLIEAVVYESRDFNGNLLARESVPKLVSTCCRAGFVIWDEKLEDDALEQIAIQPVPTARPAAAACIRGLLNVIAEDNNLQEQQA